ncbi:hypothetical protein ACQ5SO_06385 [Rhodovulum sp. DZ06]|uniref:hypothetical protein n=1 Tax=Rhodovulum sp. DZ06 TaxID=3425126 RepID=UPI003D338799
MKLRRRAIGLGQDAVRAAGTLEAGPLDAAIAALRAAHAASRGVYNPNASITKLAKRRMELAGLSELPLIAAPRAKGVGTDTACLAIACGPLPELFGDQPVAVAGMNAGRFFLFSTGADGRYSCALRLAEAEAPFLKPGEYKLVVEATPPFRLNMTVGRIFFGAAEDVARGTSVPAADGAWTGQVVSLRSGRGLRHVATLIPGAAPVSPFHAIPEMREL